MPTTALVSRPFDLVLHIGTGKAGSSSIQGFLRENRDHLFEYGLLYPGALASCGRAPEPVRQDR